MLDLVLNPPRYHRFPHLSRRAVPLQIQNYNFIVGSCGQQQFKIFQRRNRITIGSNNQKWCLYTVATNHVTLNHERCLRREFAKYFSRLIQNTKSSLDSVNGEFRQTIQHFRGAKKGECNGAHMLTTPATSKR